MSRTPERQGRPWICLWYSIIDDERFRRLSDAAGWLYVRLYALAGSEGVDGKIERNVESLAWRLREGRKKTAAALEELRGRGLIVVEEQSVAIKDWFHEQARETEAERKRRSRAQQREQRVGVSRDSVEESARTSEKSSEAVRTMSGRRPDSVRLEVEVEGEVEREVEGELDRDGERRSASSPGGPGSMKSAPGKLPTTLPDSWEPTKEHRTLASELVLDLESQAARFRAYHLAKGSTFADWDAAFSKWLRSDKFANLTASERKRLHDSPTEIVGSANARKRWEPPAEIPKAERAKPGELTRLVKKLTKQRKM